MARQRITIITRKVRKSKSTTDSKGRVHCKTCGAFLGNKRKKK